MEFAIAHGGLKLDSYSGNFKFYTKMGFEPVSWCRFKPRFAPYDWNDGRDSKEPIIFFKYTGRINAIDRHTFYSQVRPSDTYDQVMRKRDEEIKK